MKCLSLWQPWATLIAIGAKRFETRSWSTNYRGPIAIHASKKWNFELFLKLLHPCVLRAWNNAGVLQGEQPPLGVIVAVADLEECWVVLEDHNIRSGNSIRTIDDQEAHFGNYAPGRFAWELTNIRRLITPLPLTGHQGLFNLPDTLITPAMLEAV